MECTTSGYTAQLFVGGEGLRAGVFTHSLRAGKPGLSHRFTFAGITSVCLLCVGLFAFLGGRFLFCLLVFFCCLVIPLSSSEMHNYVILSMTATIVTMRAAMGQKKFLQTALQILLPGLLTKGLTLIVQGQGGMIWVDPRTDKAWATHLWSSVAPLESISNSGNLKVNIVALGVPKRALAMNMFNKCHIAPSHRRLAHPSWIVSILLLLDLLIGTGTYARVR